MAANRKASGDSALDAKKLVLAAASAERKLLAREERAEGRVKRAKARLTKAEERLTQAQNRVEARQVDLDAATQRLRSRQSARAAGPGGEEAADPDPLAATERIEAEAAPKAVAKPTPRKPTAAKKKAPGSATPAPTRARRRITAPG